MTWYEAVDRLLDEITIEMWARGVEIPDDTVLQLAEEVAAEVRDALDEGEEGEVERIVQRIVETYDTQINKAEA